MAIRHFIIRLGQGFRGVLPSVRLSGGEYDFKWIKEIGAYAYEPKSVEDANRLFERSSVFRSFKLGIWWGPLESAAKPEEPTGEPTADLNVPVKESSEPSAAGVPPVEQSNPKPSKGKGSPKK